MYLSQLVFDPWAYPVADALSDPYQMHQKVMSGFPRPLPPGERVLFRLELKRTPPQAVVLVQSRTAPDWSRLAQEGDLLRPAEVKTFDPRFASGQVFLFRLVANPTKRLRGDGQKDGPRVGLFREEDQLAWFARKAALNGFRPLSVQTEKVVQPDGWKNENGKTYCIRHLAVRFSGQLEVTDPRAFARAFAEGIGSGKGLGFGLLSLVRAA